jgi:steroid 5-alpha reductase family enzyme
VLAHRHGEAYAAYAARTGRFLPNPPGRRSGAEAKVPARDPR